MMNQLLISTAVLTLRETGTPPMVQPADRGGELALRDVLTPPGATVDQLIDACVTPGDASGVARLLARLHTLMRRGLLRLTLRMNGQDLLAVEPVVGGFQGKLPEDVAAARWRLDAFAHARAVAGQLVLEAPGSRARVIFLAPALGGVLLALAPKPCS